MNDKNLKIHHVCPYNVPTITTNKTICKMNFHQSLTSIPLIVISKWVITTVIAAEIAKIIVFVKYIILITFATQAKNIDMSTDMSYRLSSIPSKLSWLSSFFMLIPTFWIGDVLSFRQPLHWFLEFVIADACFRCWFDYCNGQQRIL